jgi:hypothetical protein
MEIKYLKKYEYYFKYNLILFRKLFIVYKIKIDKLLIL